MKREQDCFLDGARCIPKHLKRFSLDFVEAFFMWHSAVRGSNASPHQRVVLKLIDRFAHGIH